MNNKTRRDDILETAADWCDRLAQLSAAERQDFQRWLLEPEHASAFERMHRTMLDVALLDAADGVAAAAKPRFSLQAWLGRALLPKAGWGVLVGAAAMACALFVLWPQPRPVALAPQVLATAKGERRNVTLADKSVAYLNADTQVSVSYSPGERKLTLLRGEAIFQVAKDKSRPFRVITGTAMVTAVGTRFGVDRLGEAVEVRVYEGTVKVDGKGVAGQAVTRGQWLLIDPKRGISSGGFSPDQYENWRTGWLEADRMPLSYVIARLNRYTDDKIVLSDAKLGDVDLTGRFRLDNTDGTLRQIAASLDVDVVKREHRMELAPKP